jgi:hypothetical protein
MDQSQFKNPSQTLSACPNLKGLLGGTAKDPIPRGTSDPLSAPIAKIYQEPLGHSIPLIYPAVIIRITVFSADTLWTIDNSLAFHYTVSID